MNKRVLFVLAVLMISTLACKTLLPAGNPEATQQPQAVTQVPHVDPTGEIHTDDPSATMLPDTSFPDRDALPNDSGIDGVQTFPDKSYYHNHVDSVPDPGTDIPPAFGPHFSAWQNCGIYDQPVGLGNALHSLEHGAVWLTYSPDLPADQVESLRDLVRGNGYALMSPYPGQTKPVVLTAWTVQLVIDSLPDDRIKAFLDYYVNGPQNPEPGAPCDGAFGTPIE